METEGRSHDLKGLAKNNRTKIPMIGFQSLFDASFDKPESIGLYCLNFEEKSSAFAEPIRIFLFIN